MSFSNWELQPESAHLTLRLPLADAVWIMDPSLVAVQEVAIQIRVPVDEALKSRVRDYLIASLPAGVRLEGCAFRPPMAVAFEEANVQLKAGLSCEPGYQNHFALESRLLVDKNRLHSSFATVHFPGRVQQCLFRSGQFNCGLGQAQPAARLAPAWQAKIWPAWDLAAVAFFLLLLAPTPRAAAYALAALCFGHALAALAARLGAPVPAAAALFPALAAFPVYAGLLAALGERPRLARTLVGLAAGHALLAGLAGAELIRLDPVSVGGLFLLGAAIQAAPSPARGRSTGLYILAGSFGLVHGLILLRRRAEGWEAALIPLWPTLLLAAVWPLRKFLRRHLAALGLAAALAGLAVLMLRNLNLAFSALEYENALEMLRNLVQAGSASPSFITLALALSVVIGGLHALTPGHGKTIVAAYLVGTKGRTLDAVVLGLVVTLTHTSSVIVLAALVLYASNYILPDQLVPWLSVASGAMIVALGGWLFQSRLRNYLKFGTAVPVPEFGEGEEDAAAGGHGHDHDDRHDDRGHHHHGRSDHHHDHGDHTHDHEKPAKRYRTLSHAHDGVAHAHVVPVSQVGLGSLIALGITGGIVPCPDALAVLLIAVSLGRIGLGLAVIIAFSLGLAAVLIAVGIIMVQARPLFDRFSGSGKLTAFWLPMFSATAVTALGLVMLYKAWPG